MIEEPLIPHNNVGVNKTMGQPDSIADKVNKNISSTQVKDKTGYFTVTKRSGAFQTSDNVYELYATPPQGTSRGNFIYIGTNGQHTYQNVGFINITANVDTSKPYGDIMQDGALRRDNGIISLSLSFNNKNSFPNFLEAVVVEDARAVYADNTKSGIISILQSLGADGSSNLQYYPDLTNKNSVLGLSVDKTGVSVGNCFFNLPPLSNSSAGALTPTNGSAYYNTDTNSIKVYINGAWKTVTVS